MRFCTDCGALLVYKIPLDDNRQRFVCNQCHKIHYQNPLIISGCLVISNESILLCRRAIEPRKGYWTLPAGYMENNESTLEAARRETREEAGCELGELTLFALLDLVHINQLYIIYRAPLISEYFAGRESLEVKLWQENDLPWDQLAFPGIGNMLRQYFIDRKQNRFPLHHDIIYTKKDDV